MLFAAQAALEMAEVCARFFSRSPVPLNVVVWIKVGASQIFFSLPVANKMYST
jgi:hypothetical protein